MNVSLLCIHVRVFQGSVFHRECCDPSVGHELKPMGCNYTEKKMNRIEYIGKPQNMLPAVRGVTVSLNLFQLQGDRVYFDHPVTL